MMVTPSRPTECKQMSTQTVGFRGASVNRRGGSTMFFVLGLAILFVVVAGIVLFFLQNSGGGDGDAPLLASVERGPYEHMVLEQGEVESSNNVEIRCQVRSRNQGGDRSTSIIEVIPEGTVVAEGDWLITFDSSALEQEHSQQRIMVNTSEALMIQAKALYDTAVIAKTEYLEGTYNELRKTILNEVFLAEEELKKAELAYASIQRLVARGLLTELQQEGEKFKVDAAQNALDLAKQKLQVLGNYTKPKMLVQLESDIRSSEVTFKNEEDSHKTELDKLKEFEDQIEACKVHAPQSGQVVYANVRSSRSGSEFVVEAGAAVKERQVILRLPDPQNMQVKAKINEARVNLVRVGMPVSIRIDAFGDESLQGEVTKVNKYAEPGSWWSSSTKQYATLIRIIAPPPEIRVGLTAEVQIHVEHEGDAMQLPVQTVYERGGKTFCLVQNGEEYDTREVFINSTNQKVVAVDETRSELEVGEKVVANARKHVDLFDESRFPQESEAQGQPPEDVQEDAQDNTVAQRTEEKPDSARQQQTSIPAGGQTTSGGAQ